MCINHCNYNNKNIIEKEKTLNIIEYISGAMIPIIISIIIFYGLIEKKNVFDIFLIGAKEGIDIVIKMLPTLIGLFVAVGLLRISGILDTVVAMLSPIIKNLQIPEAIMPLILLRPISGSAATAVATEIMNTHGVDNFIGLITSTIIGATETTLYTITIYSSCIGAKKTRFVLLAALAGDLVGVFTSILIWRNLS